MKKSLYAIFSILLLCSLVCICCLTVFDSGTFAYAASDDYPSSPIPLTPVVNNITKEVEGVSFETYARTVYIYRMVDQSGKPAGVSFAGYYFGESGIKVSAEVYSSDEFAIDFNVGAKDVDLTASQLERRNALVQLFYDVSTMIDRVDDCANTTYDGSSVGNTNPVSDVYLYNQLESGNTLEISRYTYKMLKLAREMYEDTGGAFNPAVYRLVDLWGFSSRIYSYGNFGLAYDRPITGEEFAANGYPLPDQKYIDAFSDPRFTDFSQEAVTLEEKNGQYFVTKNVAPAVVDGEAFEQWIDLGGVAKGYAVDLARQMIANLGIDRFFVNAGSSSIATGWEYDGGNTELGLEDAFDSLSSWITRTLLKVEIGKSSVSTSGQNVRKYTVNGIEYAHIIDGTRGAPAQMGVRSVMVVVPEEAGEFWATKGDCLTTALTVMGREAIVEFVNGYLKDNGIKIVVQYETFDGRKQLLSNYSQEEVQGVSDSFSEFGWALKQDAEGNFYYDADADYFVPKSDGNEYLWLLITLGSLLGAGAVALVVYHFVRGRNRTVTNVQNAKKDKPFKVIDVMVYIGVVMVILVLFYVFVLDVETVDMQMVYVIDEDTGETLYIYNVVRGEGYANLDNSNGWQIVVDRTDNGVDVTFTREIRGETHYNTVRITGGRNPSVKVVDSICGFSKECVRNFSALTHSNEYILCAPNRLKVITE